MTAMIRIEYQCKTCNLPHGMQIPIALWNGRWEQDLLAAHSEVVGVDHCGLCKSQDFEQEQETPYDDRLSWDGRLMK